MPCRKKDDVEMKMDALCGAIRKRVEHKQKEKIQVEVRVTLASVFVIESDIRALGILIRFFF